MHLDEMHSDGTRRTAPQDDLDDVADAILGFFRGAGKAVLGTDAVGRQTNERRRVVEDGPGVVRSLTAGFMNMRRAAVSAARLEDNRVERRIERLALAHSGSDVAEAEQRVVAWEPDDSRDVCPLCARRFGRVSVRRHHCRICGRVVCGSCTSLLEERLRMCADCGRTVARIQGRRQETIQGGVVVKYYADIRAGMEDAERLLPVFKRMMGGRDLGRAAAVRAKLTRAFGDADRASKLVAALPADSPTDARLHAAIRRAVVMYLQTHMFTLALVPSKSGSLPTTPKPVSRSTSIDQQPLQTVAVCSPDPPPPVPSPVTSLPVANGAGGLAASLLSFVIAPRPAKPVEPLLLDDLVERALDADPQRQARLADTPLEEKLDSLQVLRDQRQRVLGYISEAQRERRLEDAISLQTSLSDLDVELSIIERNL
ncbi:carboxypeptidase Y-deficient [Coemansia sp. RSA 376]|nr:carboxypeptidase Y-deficient [Coemansia sp. RSA 376]